jgi:hypothetical protein
VLLKLHLKPTLRLATPANKNAKRALSIHALNRENNARQNHEENTQLLNRKEAKTNTSKENDK